MDDPRIAVMKRVFEGWAARDFDALLSLVDPDVVARLTLPPGAAVHEYRGTGEIAAFLEQGDADYERFDADTDQFAIGPNGHVFAEGSVSYRSNEGGMASRAYWVCEVRDGKIVSWHSFSDRRSALAAAGIAPSAKL